MEKRTADGPKRETGTRVFHVFVAGNACLVCLFMLGFISVFLSEAGTLEKGSKADLVVAYSPKSMTDVDPKDAMAAFKLYVQELAKSSGKSASSYPFDSVEAVMKEVEKGNVDLVSMSSLEYQRLKNRNLLEPALARARGGKATCRYLLLTHQKSSYTKLADLRGKKISVVKGAELGTFYIDTMLHRQRLGEAKEFFSQIDEKVKPSQVVLSVFFGQADACIIDDVQYGTMAEMNPQLEKGLKVLSASPELVEAVSFFRKGTDEETKRLTFQAAKELKTHSRGKQILMLFKMDDLVPVREADLAAVRDLVKEHGRLKAGR